MELQQTTINDAAKREKRRQQMKSWSQNNKEKRRIYLRERMRIVRLSPEFKERERGYNEAYRLRHVGRCLLRAAKQRAKKKGLSFELRASDIIIPAICPILGIPIIKDSFRTMPKTDVNASANAPSLDRIDPRRGYSKDNIQVISWRANCLKRDATAEELRRLATYMTRLEGKLL